MNELTEEIRNKGKTSWYDGIFSGAGEVDHVY